MESEVVKYAPKAVIDELDTHDFSDRLPETLLVAIGRMDYFVSTDEWSEESNSREKQLAIINHVFGNERLQPEREPRWTVEKEINGYTKSLVFESGETYFRSYTPAATYMFGLTEKQARGYAELFGGEAKEIK